MGVSVECKLKCSNEETSSSTADTGLNPSTIASTNNIPITGQGDAYEPKQSSMEKLVPTIAVARADGVRSITVEPANKRMKLENEATTTITAESEDGAISGCLTNNGMGISSSVVAKAPIATTASVHIMGSSLGITKPVVSVSTCCDNVTNNAITAKETSTTAKSEHSVAHTTFNGQQTESQAIPPPISTSSCQTGSTRVTRNVPIKVESSSSSNNSQEESSSVITASIESSPQHTSQSSHTDSSNESLHDSETNPSTAASPSANRGSRQLAPVAQPLTTGSPTTPASSNTVAPKKNPSVATTKPADTRTLSSPFQTIPVTTHVPPTSMASTTTAPVPNISSNAISHNKEVPLKSLNFGHLRIKYLGELEYMLREFRKLERQLLGAKGAQQLEESVGSRERREKLHSFILHLEDTIRQIEMGSKLEDEGRCNTLENRNEASATVMKKGTGDDGNASATSTGSVNNPIGNTTNSTSDIAAEEAKKQLAQESALSNLTNEKEEEENVQKLEEHILANLLPVKVRLKKQLAAQQGATQNPPGMPAMRRGTLQPSSTTRGKGTFVEAVEKKRKHAESLRLAAQVQHERQVRSVSDPTQFGKPLSGVGSSLTKKLHGSTLGSKHRRTGHGVGSSIVSKDTQERKILHAGMVPKSTQQKSGLSAASGAHEIMKSPVQHSNKSNNKPATVALAASLGGKSTPSQSLQTNTKMAANAGIPKRTIVSKMEPKTSAAATTRNINDTVMPNKTVITTNSSAPLSEEDRLKFKKHRRLRKLKRLKRRRERELARQQLSKSQQQLSNNTQSASNAAVGRKKVGHAKVGQKKKGPRVVEYICSQCSEAYSSTCDFNPWWALAQHKCPKCQKTQIPRIDITSPANAIEYHPALLSHLDDGGRGGGGSISANSAQTVAQSMPIVSQIPNGANSVNSESDSDLSELSDDNISIGSLKAAELESELQSMTPAERAEHETFGKEYEGPVLSEDYAAKLLILMAHASTCPGHHKSEKLKDVCRSIKYMMLHVRDCPGTTSTYDVCPFPWCRKVKHLLYHLVSCEEPDQCRICSPKELPKGLKGLVGLNAHRMKKHRERLLAITKASLPTKGAKTNTVTKKQSTTRRTASATQANNIRKDVTDMKASAAQQNSLIRRPTSTQAPVKLKTENILAPAPYISPATVVASIETGDINSDHVQTSVTTQMHPAMTQPPTHVVAASNDLDFDINAEIAKLDEQLGSNSPEANQTCIIVPIKHEPDMPSTTVIANAKVEANAVSCMTTNYTTLSASETTNDQVLPTPVAAIKMEDHDADAAELSDLLASNSSSEEHQISNAIPEGDVGDVSEYLKNEYHIPTQHPQDSVRVTEHQQQIDIDSGVPGVDTLNDPNSDPLANINHEIFIESSQDPHTTLVVAPGPTNTCGELKQEYSEAVSETSVQPSPNISSVTATAADVKKTIGSVKVN